MRNKNIFRLLSLILFVIFAFSFLTTSAMGASRTAVTAAGVVGPTGDILFSVNDNYSVTRTDVGVYLITVDARLECLFFPDDEQAALGPRLVTPAFNGIQVRVGLIRVPSDIVGLCNDPSLYRVQLSDSNFVPINGVFSFQIIGIIDRPGVEPLN